VSCQCGANCQPRKHPAWLRGQLDDAISGLLAISNITTNGFCCPLCLRLLPRSCANVAHAPSEELGGKAQTFICASCNSFLGRTYEASVETFITALRDEASTGTVNQKISISNPGGPHIYMNAAFSGTDDESRRIDAKPIRRNPETEARFGAGKKRGQSLLVRYKVPSEEGVKLAYLSWAFLLLFRRLGYAFVFSTGGRLARHALLAGTTKHLSPAFFFTYGTFAGAIAPSTVGLVVRGQKRRFDSVDPVALGAEVGLTVIALPLADPEAYAHLLEYTTDGSGLLVLPFDVMYPDQTPALPGIAAYQWLGSDEKLHDVLRWKLGEVLADLAAAQPPPTSHPKKRRYQERAPDWVPPALPLPPQPRDRTWRTHAAEYLAHRGTTVELPADDEAWIAEIERLDPVAASHVSDMRDLFERGKDPRRTEPRGIAVFDDLARVVRESDASARMTAADSRLVNLTEGYSSNSVRIVRDGEEIIVGPHYTYGTLVLAVRVALSR
jgi:hypothetical protein